VLYSGAQLMIE